MQPNQGSNLEKADLHKLLSFANVPKRLWDVSLYKVPDLPYKREFCEVLDNLDDFVSDGNNLYFCGPYGSGKSSLASILCASLFRKAFAKKSIKIYWVRREDIPGYLVDPQLKEERLWWDQKWRISQYIKDCHVLVIDEFYMTGHSFQDSAVESLYRRRLDWGGCTVFTSNQSPVQFKDTFPGMYSVLHESCGWLCVEGHDFRLPK